MAHTASGLFSKYCIALGICRNDNEVIICEYLSTCSRVDSKNFLNNCIYVTKNGYGDTDSTTIYSDFITSSTVIGLCGFVLAFVLSLLFVTVLKIPFLLVAVMWTCIVAIALLGVFCSYMLITNAKQYSNIESISTTEIQLMQGLGGLCAAFTFLWVSFAIFMRKRFNLAASLVKESASAISSMWLLGSIPIWQTILFAGVTALWLYFGIYLVSSADIGTVTDPVTKLTFTTLSFDVHCKRAIIYLVGSWFWTIAFIEAMGQLVTSHAVLCWYFAVDRYQIGSMVVLKSVGHSATYHMGTAACGSLIIATIRIIRMTLELAKRRIKTRIKKFSTLASWFIKIPFFFLSALLWVLEKIMKFLNKHAFIMCSLFGGSFLLSARRAFKLIVRNLGRTVSLQVALVAG
jgi:choline transporter-like protein 2/4/5